MYLSSHQRKEETNSTEIGSLEHVQTPAYALAHSLRK